MCSSDLLEAFLNERVPGYMVPSVFVELDTIPRNRCTAEAWLLDDRMSARSMSGDVHDVAQGGRHAGAPDSRSAQGIEQGHPQADSSHNPEQNRQAAGAQLGFPEGESESCAGRLSREDGNATWFAKARLSTEEVCGMFSSSVAGATPVSRLDCVIGQLCAPEAMSDIAHSPLHNAPMPSLEISGYGGLTKEGHTCYMPYCEDGKGGSKIGRAHV